MQVVAVAEALSDNEVYHEMKATPVGSTASDVTSVLHFAAREEEVVQLTDTSAAGAPSVFAAV